MTPDLVDCLLCTIPHPLGTHRCSACGADVTEDQVRFADDGSIRCRRAQCLAYEPDEDRSCECCGADAPDACQCRLEYREGRTELLSDERGTVYGWGSYTYCTTHKWGWA